MILLSIETSCDETALALLSASTDVSLDMRLLGNALYSQAHTHAEYGGVFPSLAKREHAKNLVPLLSSALSIAHKNGLHTTQNKTNLSEENLNTVRTILSREEGLADQLISFIKTTNIPPVDAIAVTQGPGLEPALWVGISFAKALSFAWNIPVIPVNHMEGHIVSVLMGTNTATIEPAVDQGDNQSIIPAVAFPALALLISGGHTEIVHIKGWHQYEVIGRTRDDAVGEAFDKAARIMGLPYPGGPHISKRAAEHRADSQAERPYTLPRPMIHSDNFDFSFSGIKTAVLYLVRNIEKESQNGTLTDTQKRAIAEEFEQAVTDVLIEKTRKALIHTGAQTLILGGGVIANTYIRQNFAQLVSSEFPEVRLFVPSIDMSTDNAVMIGIAGYLRFLGQKDAVFATEFRAEGNLSL